MDPLSLATAIAVATTVVTKALEKTGEKLGERAFELSERFLKSLRGKSPSTALAIEKASQEPLDYGQAALEISALARTDSTFADTIQALAAVAEEEENTKLSGTIQEIKETLNFQQPVSQDVTKVIAEKIAVFNQGNVQKQTNNITF